MEKPVRRDVNSIQFSYETAVECFGWDRRSCNPNDVGTKLNSLFGNTFALTRATGSNEIKLTSMLVAQRDRLFRFLTT